MNTVQYTFGCDFETCLKSKIYQKVFIHPVGLNTYPPGALYVRQWTGAALLQVMAFRLFSTKPLPEPMLTYCQLDPWTKTSLKFELKYEAFHSW